MPASLQVNISIIVPDDRAVEAVQALHKCFFEGDCIVPSLSACEAQVAV